MLFYVKEILETQNPNAEEPENRLYEYLNQIEQLIFGSGEKDGLLAIDSEATMGIKNYLSERKKKRLDRFIEALDTPEYLTQLKETIQLILYNYRDIVEKTKLRLKNKTQKTHINSLNISKSS